MDAHIEPAPNRWMTVHEPDRSSVDRYSDLVVLLRVVLRYDRAAATAGGS